MVDKEYLDSRLYKWFFGIDKFHHEHVIVTTDPVITNFFEKENYMIFLSPTGFINVQA